MGLEQTLDLYRPVQRQQVYFVVGDLERLSASALYMADRFYDFKHSGFQLHIHENKEGKLTGAKIKPYGSEDKKSEVPLSNCDAYLAELRAIKLGVPRVKKGS